MLEECVQKYMVDRLCFIPGLQRDHLNPETQGLAIENASKDRDFRYLRCQSFGTPKIRQAS
jgi:hypothetical protein